MVVSAFGYRGSKSNEHHPDRLPSASSRTFDVRMLQEISNISMPSSFSWHHVKSLNIAELGEPVKLAGKSWERTLRPHRTVRIIFG